MRFVEGVEVTISGTVTADEPIRAPLTGEPCVLHRTHLRIWDRLDVAGNLVDDLVFAYHTPFTIEADGERVHITADTAFELAIRPLDIYPHPAHAVTLLGRYAPFVSSTFYDHVVIRPGDRITATGVVARGVASDGEHGYRETSVVTRLVGYDGRPLRISR